MIKISSLSQICSAKKSLTASAVEQVLNERNRLKQREKLLEFFAGILVFQVFFRKNNFATEVEVIFQKKANKNGEMFLHVSKIGVCSDDGVKAKKLFSLSDIDLSKDGYLIDEKCGDELSEALAVRLTHPSNFRILNKIKAAVFSDDLESAHLVINRKTVESFLEDMMDIKVVSNDDEFFGKIETFVIKLNLLG
jgi:hypothetical protein